MTEERRGRRGRLEGHPRRHISVIGVLGEVLITAGVLVFLFLGWQLWLNDMVVGAQQDSVGADLAKKWSGSVPIHTHVPAAPKDYGEPILETAPKDAIEFAVMYVPRFGSDYVRSISEGVSVAAVLNRNGIGHYPGTQMPGQVGNFAVAAHRTTHGAPFKLIATLRVGDKIYVQTKDGYYTYEFRGLEYVRPTGVGVLDPVPQDSGAQPTDRLLTMTSCNPMYEATERIIAYASMVSWQPTSAGPPAPIASEVASKG